MGLTDQLSIGIVLWQGSTLYRSRAPRMLRRKPTRIELKPDDREEYFAHKQAKQPDSESKDKPSDKDTRIGITKPR